MDETCLLFTKDAAIINKQQEWQVNLSELVGEQLTTGSVNQ